MARSKKKILLVDDSNTVLLMHKLLLSKFGYELIVARDGREAVEKAKAEKPDLIFLDVVMPEMSGFEACRLLRATAGFESVPIIMVSTRGEPASLKEGYASGCTEYMTKPFNSLELSEKLRAYLPE